MAHLSNSHKGKRYVQTDAHDVKAGRAKSKRNMSNRHKRRMARWMYREQMRMRSEYLYVNA